MRIFVSSVMSGFEPYREAAFAAIRSLDHEIIRAEDFPASTTSSRVACLQGVRAADLVILILGARYGWSDTASGLSPTHEEFREAKEQGKAIPFVQSGVARETAQEQFVAEVEDYDGGMHRGRTFADPEELRTEITRAISRYQLAAATTPVDVASMVQKASNLIPREDRGMIRMTGPLLQFAAVGGPSQTIIRPSDIEARTTIDGLVAALSSPEGFFSYTFRTQPRLESGALQIDQENGAAFRIDEAGAMLLSVPIARAEGHLHPLIEGHVRAAIERALSFADQVLERFDATQRLTRLVLAAGITGSSAFGWRTEAEHAASPNSMQGSMRQQGDDPVFLNPADRTRMALRAERANIAEDVTTLLRRQHQA